MSLSSLDIYILVFFIIMVILGYKKGFITRLYDIVSLLIVLYLSYILSNPLSHMISFNTTAIDDPIIKLITQFSNQFITFVILFVALFIVKKIIGIIIKPILNRIIKIFSLTDFMNHILGALISFVEAFVLSYIAIVLLMTPLYKQGSTMIQDSIAANKILNVMPTLSSEVTELTSSMMELSESHDSSQDVISLMILAYDYHLINDEQIDLLINEYIMQNVKKIELTNEQMNTFKKMIESSGVNQGTKDTIIKKVSVCDE